VIVHGVSHNPGHAEGEALVLDEPLSMWGGVDPATGEIIDRYHPQCGRSVAGSVLVLPHGRGSSGGSSVLAECVRAGTAPVAVVMRRLDVILLVGSLVAAELYPDRPCPVVELVDGYDELRSGWVTTVRPDGTVEQR